MIESRLKVVASGGGRPDGKSAESMRHAVELTGVPKPKVLIDTSPKTTTETADRGFQYAHNLFGDELGLETSLLREHGASPSADEMIEKIQAADLIYISGGDTDQLIKTWRKLKVADYLAEQAMTGQIVISGISAGAIAPFRWGLSDSMSYRIKNPGDHWDYISVDGLNLVNAAITPHNNSVSEMHGKRSDLFLDMFTKLSPIGHASHGFGIDNFAALRVVDGKISQVPTSNDAHIYYTRRDGDTISTETIHPDDTLIL